MTDFVRKSFPQTPDQPSLFLSLVSSVPPDHSSDTRPQVAQRMASHERTWAALKSLTLPYVDERKLDGRMVTLIKSRLGLTDGT